MPPKKSAKDREKEVLSVPVAEQMNSKGAEDPMPTEKAKQMENGGNIGNGEAPPSNGFANGHDDEVQPPATKKRGRPRNVPQQSVEPTEKNGSDAVGVEKIAKGEEADEPQSDEDKSSQASVSQKRSQENLHSQEKLEEELETKETAPKKGKGRPPKQDAKSVDVPEQTKPEVTQVGQDSQEKLEEELETKETAPKKGKGRPPKPDAKSVDVPEQTKPEVSQVGQDSDEKPELELETTSKKGKGRPRKQDAKLVDVPEQTKQEVSQVGQDSEEKAEQELETKETTSKKARGRPRKLDAKLVSVPEVVEQEPQQEVEQEITSKKGRKQEKASKKSSNEEPVIESRRGLKRRVGDPSSIAETKILRVSLLRQKRIDDMVLEELNGEGKVKGAVGPSKPGRKRGREGGEDAAKPSKATKAASTSSSKKEKIPDVSALDFGNTSTTKSGEAWNLKIASWNINGVRAWLEKDGVSYLHKERPDVLCVQETKCSKEKLPKEANIEGYHCYWLAGDKEGYSGVGVLSKQKPLAVEYGIGVDEFDAEGRVIMADFDKFYLVAAYVPNAGRGLVRLEDRKRWDVDFRAYLKKLDATKPVILCGDLNVAHKEIDLANPKTNKKNAGFTQEERDGFSSLLSEGFVDTYRTLYPDKAGAYTFWTYMMNARAKNVGWRLDYFVMSERFVDRLCDCVIRSEVMGSDHCPLVLFLNV